MKSNHREINGIPMRWEEHGGGAPVVFVHGIPTTPALWRHVVPLVPAARSLAWEMTGYGDSIPAGRGRHLSVSRQADHLLAWLDALELRRVILVGHDLGGGVAQIAAVRRPELFSGLLLTNCIAYDSWPIPEVKAMRAFGALVERLPDSLFGPILRGFIRRGHDDADRGRESADLHWQSYAKHGAASAFVRQIRALHTNDTLAVADALPRLSIPARILWGVADSFQKIEYGERLAHDLRAPLERIEGGLHFTPEDHPEIIAKGVQALLDAPASDSA